MKTLETITLLDLLPPNFKAGAMATSETGRISVHCQALAAALDVAFKGLVQHSQKVKVYADLDHLDESGLDLLAMQWKIKGYKDTLPIANKRQLVKNGLVYQLFSGTAKVIKDKVAAVYNDDAIVKEWFEYNGEPYTFRVDIETENGLNLTQLDEAQRLIEENKNVRSHLDKFNITLLNKIPLYLGAGMQNGESLRVLPYITKAHQASISLYLAAFALSGEIIHVSPKLEQQEGA